MSVQEILADENELTHLLGAQQAVVLSTRVRLARNLEGFPFPGWAKPAHRKEIAERCIEALTQLPRFRKSHVFKMGGASPGIQGAGLRQEWRSCH